jgi:acyl-CoA thioesterase
MEQLKKSIRERDRFAAHNGVELLEVREGYARAEMVVQTFHLNGVGIVHGAAVFTLADLAFAAASNSRGNVAVGINVNVAYMKAAVEGVRLTAEATEQNVSNRLGQYVVRITDEEGDLVAVMNGMVYRKSQSTRDAFR